MNGYLFLAFLWQQSTQLFNFGHWTPVVRSADGRGEFYLEQKYNVHYVLVVTWDGKTKRWQLNGLRAPKRVFWMLDGKAIGVEYHAGPPMICYVEHCFRIRDMDIDALVKLTQEEIDKANSYRVLSPEEQKLFEEAKRLAEKSP